MSRFAYLAVDPDGRERSGALDASSEADARARLQRKNWMPLRVTASAEGAASLRRAADTTVAPGAARGRKLSLRSQTLFARQLATLIDASVPMDEALALIGAQQETETGRRIVEDLHEAVLEGRRLAEAMGRHPRSFPPLVRAAVAGGERASNLGVVLTRLADYLARAHALRSKITTALIYPAALSIVAVSVVACLMIFVVPSLTEQFRSFDARLPIITQALIAVSGFLGAFWPLVLAGLISGGFLLRTVLARPTVALAVDRALLNGKFVGRWVRTVTASRFSRALATLIGSGLPVRDSVSAARGSVGNRHAALMIDRMGAWIEEGEPLSAAMRRAGFFPSLATYMVASGEGAGELPGMLEKAADHLDQEFEAFTTTALSLFEPAVIVAMGAVIASIVLAIMLPILQLNQLAIG